jgi:RNA polymerase subunit RPABC4/transcription elongation factor Spt4
MEKKQEEQKTGQSGPILMCPFCKDVYNTEPIMEQTRLEICPNCGKTFWFGALLLCHWDFEIVKNLMLVIQNLLPAIEERLEELVDRYSQ